MNAAYRGMTMCHMMADKIGVQRKWIQKAGTPHEHFDICLSKKKKAVAMGAKEVGWKEMADLMAKKKAAQEDGNNGNQDKTN